MGDDKVPNSLQWSDSSIHVKVGKEHMNVRNREANHNKASFRELLYHGCLLI